MEFGKVLTNPCDPAGNNGRDNVDGNLICRIGDVFYALSSAHISLPRKTASEEIVEEITRSRDGPMLENNCDSGGYAYTIDAPLGSGTFGQVFRCRREALDEHRLRTTNGYPLPHNLPTVAVKVIKNKAAYRAQGLLEIRVARTLNTIHDPMDSKHIVRLVHSFEYRNHICLVFELLGGSLLDLLAKNQYRGLPLSLVRNFTIQILHALCAAEDDGGVESSGNDNDEFGAGDCDENSKLAMDVRMDFFFCGPVDPRTPCAILLPIGTRTSGLFTLLQKF